MRGQPLKHYAGSSNMRTINKLLQDESGPTSVEYAVMLAFILLVCLVAIQTLGISASNMWSNNQQQLEQM